MCLRKKGLSFFLERHLADSGQIALWNLGYFQVQMNRKDVNGRAGNGGWMLLLMQAMSLKFQHGSVYGSWDETLNLNRCVQRNGRSTQRNSIFRIVNDMPCASQHECDESRIWPDDLLLPDFRIAHLLGRIG